jgi:hypothetical protein
MLTQLTTEFAADDAVVSARQQDNFADALLGVKAAVNLVLLLSAEELVHLAT